jgi:hypothetical protein
MSNSKFKIQDPGRQKSTPEKQPMQESLPEKQRITTLYHRAHNGERHIFSMIYDPVSQGRYRRTAHNFYDRQGPDTEVPEGANGELILTSDLFTYVGARGQAIDSFRQNERGIKTRRA